MRITQSLSVGGSKQLAGHLRQEVEDTVDKLLQAKPEKVVLVPSRETATGFRVLELQDRHKDAGFVIDKERAPDVIAPPPELLAAFKHIATRRAFVPEVHSQVLDRNLRFLVSLPPNFDAKKAAEYPVVHVLPDSRTMSWHLAEGGLNDKLDEALHERGLDDAIVVVSERLEHSSSADRDAVNARGKAALSGEVQAYVSKAFGTAPKIDATLTLPSLNDYRAIIDPSRREMPKADRSAFVADQLDQRARESDGKKKGGLWSSMFSLFMGDDEPRARPRDTDVDRPARKERDKGDDWGSSWKKPSWDGAIVVAGGDRPKVTQASSWDGKIKVAKLPEAKFFSPLKDRDAAGVAVAALPSKIAGEAVPYAVVVPKGFDPKRRYPVDVVSADGAKLKDVVEKLGAASLDVGDRIVLVADSASFPKGGLADHVKYELLAAVSDQLPLDLSRVHDARSLGADPAQWASRVAEAPQTPVHGAGGPVVFSEGEWVQTAPTTDYERSFPRIGWGVKGDTAIPREMQKQPADHGTMFVPVIDSKAVGKDFRCGVYLPPGYDPSSSEKLPILVMLPGKGGDLQQWTSVGGVTQKLDAAMAGDHQKMIVVIPDKTDSLWFDYDKNGEPSFGDKGKRNFEGLLVDEILPFVTKTLNADSSKMAVAGISRGGFGAMSLAARHPGMFQSVSAHSGVLALEHDGGELGKHASGEIQKHFGPEGHPIWSQVVPKDLVQSGAFDKKTPRLLVDIGADDPYFVGDNLAFDKALADKGIPHEMHIYGGDADKKHNWDTWSALLPSWIAFHQKTFGKAAQVALKDVVDLTAEVKSDHAEALKKRAAELQERIEGIEKSLPSLSDADRSRTVIGYSEGDRRVYRPLASLQEGIDDVARQLRSLRGKPMHVLEARVPRLEGQVDELRQRLERGRKSMLGETPPPVEPAPGALSRLPGVAQDDLRAALAVVPGLERPLAKLATVRPSVFQGDDEVTGAPFARQLRDFVRSDVFDAKKDGAGLCEFIDRMAERRYDWRRGGFSNAVTATMNTIFNHPGIVLSLTEASRRDTALEFPAFYKGDPATRLKPMGDLKAAFSRVDGTDSGFGWLPGGELGYERAILRIVRDELCPPKESMPSTRAFGARTNMPVAEGLAKLRGREVLYGYAMKIKTGEDLVKAVESQGKEGLAMSDMKLGYGGQMQSLHFPVFYDYDEKSRTIEMQHWGQGPVRLQIDGLKLDDVGVYYEPTPGMEQFLTPEKQSNWDAIKAAREGRDPDKKPRWRDDD